MSLRDQIQKDTRSALKNKQEIKLSTLRFLNAQIQNAEIEKRRQELTNEEIIKLIKSQIKKLKEGLTFFEKGKRIDLIKQAKEEIKILSNYLPQQLSNKELAKEIQKIIDKNFDLDHPGALIGLAIKKLTGQADNQRIAEIVKKKLNES